MLKSQEIAQQITNKMEEIKNLAGEEKQALFAEIKNLKADLDIQREVEAMTLEEAPAIENKVVAPVVENKGEEVSLLKAMIKNAKKTPLTQREAEVIQNAVTGEEHIELKELSTRIHEYLRHEESLKRLVTVYKTKAKTGSFPVHNSTVAKLKAITDGVTMNPEQDLTFEQVKFEIKKYGLLGQLTDTILKYSVADLVDYMAKLFVKAYVKKVNEMVCEIVIGNPEANANGSVELAPARLLKSLVSHTRLDLDPALRGGAVLLMSPEAFDLLANDESGATEVNWIQPDLSKPATPYINGYRVELVYDDKFKFAHDGAGNTGATHDRYFIAFANTKELVYMFENEEYAVSFSSEAGFLNNTVYSKIITYFDMKKVDAQAVKLYHIDIVR